MHARWTKPITHSAPQSLSNQLFTFHRRLLSSCVLGAVTILISMPRFAYPKSYALSSIWFIRHKIIVDSTSLDSPHSIRKWRQELPWSCTALTMAAPPFWLAQVRRRYCQVDLATCTQILIWTNTDPGLEVSVTGRAGWLSTRDASPICTSAHDPQNAVHHLARVTTQSTSVVSTTQMSGLIRRHCLGSSGGHLFVRWPRCTTFWDEF